MKGFGVIGKLLAQQKFCSNFFEGSVCRGPQLQFNGGGMPMAPNDSSMGASPDRAAGGKYFFCQAQVPGIGDLDILRAAGRCVNFS